jgi:hypothetical protein
MSQTLPTRRVRAAREAAKQPRSESKPSEAWAPAKN